MKIIPAIDIIDGKCVRLVQGAYESRIQYANNPVEVAKSFEAEGLQFVHIVDLDGAKSRSPKNLKLVERIATTTSLKIDFGGGIQEKIHLSSAFEAGASKVTLGSIAATQRETTLSWLSEFGSERLVLGADCREGLIKTSGWTEDSGLDVLSFIDEYQKAGFTEVICTDIAKDGMLNGPSIDLYRKIIASSNVKLIASGGVKNESDLLALKGIGCAGAIVGRAIYEGTINLKTLSDLC